MHADTLTLLHNLEQDGKDEQCAIYHRLTERLAKAGAECVVVTSISGHFCIDDFANTAIWLAERNMQRVGILGTDTIMRSGMCGKLQPIEVIAPQGSTLPAVYEAYIPLAT
ncbi:MAG: hypothetical protein AAF234_18045 [Pseudomonadota bacterium]